MTSVEEVEIKLRLGVRAQLDGLALGILDHAATIALDKLNKLWFLVDLGDKEH